MSAWSEAAWIVQKLQKNFDLSEDIRIFNTNINGLNTKINDVDEVFDDLNNYVNNNLNLPVVTIVSLTPPTGNNMKNGAIWFKRRN